MISTQNIFHTSEFSGDPSSFISDSASVSGCGLWYTCFKNRLVDSWKFFFITGPIYGIYCQGQTTRDKCKEFYIGETERSLKTRLLEHKRPSSTSSEVSNHIHIESPGHHIDLDEVKILDREPRWFERGVKEAINIKMNNSTFNKDGAGTNFQESTSLFLGQVYQKVTA